MSLTKNSTGFSLLTKENKEDNSGINIALAGNPNVGKSTVFNALTGLNQHTGNWPGKTVSNAVGYFFSGDKKINVVDLPGTYSLLSNSQEERIARDYLCFDEPDAVVVVADATSLERNLNLFLQVSEITDKVILCINLVDEARRKGITINKKLLKQKLGTEVIFTTAREGIGIKNLKQKINKLVDSSENKTINVLYNEVIEKGIFKISSVIKNQYTFKSEKELRWVALRLLEGNEKICRGIIKKYDLKDNTVLRIKRISRYIRNISDSEVGDNIVESLVTTAEDICSECVSQSISSIKDNRRIDKILVSKKFGIPIMILGLILILWITISLANYPSTLLSKLFSLIEGYIRDSYFVEIAPSWLSGLLIDGVYMTLQWVISVMLPPMAIFFPLFTLLEDLGYLPRIAFNLDKCFKKCCSCGKQALTMCMGLGCNAAGVVGCRIINSPRERLIAILTNVFMPCNGRFPTLIVISTIFIGGMFTGGFEGNIFAALSVAIIIIIGVMMTFICSKILSKTILKGVPSNFILELPEYRKPQIGRILIRSLLDRTLYIVGRAIIIAAPVGAVIWIFANIKVGNNSVLTVCAEFLNPFAKLIGLDGYILMAFILGLPANEIVMPIIIMSYLKSGYMLEMDNLLELKNLLVNNGWTMLTAINMMILCLMHYPCGTTLWTIKKETKSVKWTIIAFLLPTICGIIICFITSIIWRLFF